MFSARFWGVRGSIPCPGPDTVIYGGNTACIEIRADERLLIVDLGSGARPLGEWLLANDYKKYGKISADIFITHTHWDHILGFPMFSPIYNSGTELRITGPVVSENDSLNEIFKAQFSHNFWPVRLDELAAKIEYNQINETTLDLGGGLAVTSQYLNHPTKCLGYRFDYQGKSIAVFYDHEPFSDEKENEKLIRFLKGVDILIHDAQYTTEEYLKRIGWGHSSLEHAVLTAVAAEAKKLIFFHHEPTHTDRQLEQMEKDYANSKVQCIMAREGIILEI
jgi:phosphoribosyl 1,2-cyclic phosphodiesterase